MNAGRDYESIQWSRKTQKWKYVFKSMEPYEQRRITKILTRVSLNVNSVLRLEENTK